jgi:hypothetical protein
MLEERRKLIQEVKGSSHHSIILWPSKFLVEPDEDNEVAEVKEESVFKWMPCALCDSPFPNKDVVLAPCMCLYHPWCIVMQNWVSKSCAKEDCRRIFGEAWQRSYGLFYIQGNARLHI